MGKPPPLGGICFSAMRSIFMSACHCTASTLSAATPDPHQGCPCLPHALHSHRGPGQFGAASPLLRPQKRTARRGAVALVSTSLGKCTFQLPPLNLVSALKAPPRTVFPPTKPTTKWHWVYYATTTKVEPGNLNGVFKSKIIFCRI